MARQEEILSLCCGGNRGETYLHAGLVELREVVQELFGELERVEVAGVLVGLVVSETMSVVVKRRPARVGLQ